MHDIAELQRRIISALDRIGHGIESIDGLPGEGGEAASLQAALEAERARSAELRERLGRLESEGGRELRETRDALEQAQALLSEIEADRNRLKAANEALSEAARSLREASVQGLADADLVNAAALTEIETLRTMRDSDRAELGALIRVIEPVAAN